MASPPHRFSPTASQVLANAAVVPVLAVAVAVNFLLHREFPTVIGWLPAGIALAVTLIAGKRIMPGAGLGIFLGMILSGTTVAAAGAHAVSSAAACLAASYALEGFRRSDGTDLTVAAMARLLLLGGLCFGVVAGASGPLGIAMQVPHNRSADLRHDEAVPAPAHAAPHSVSPHSAASSPVAHEMPHTMPAPTADSAHRADAAPSHLLPHAPATDVAAKHASAGGVRPAHPMDSRPDLLERLLSEPIGILLVLPAAFYFHYWRRQSAGDKRSQTLAWTAFVSLLAVSLAIYSGFLEQRFGIVHTTLLVLPPAVWLALEYDMAFTLAGNVAVMAIVGIGTAMGHGPFKDHTSGLPLLTAVYCLTTLLIAASSSERRAASAIIFRLATRDPLTGLLNRAALLERVEQSLASARRHHRRIALMFIDFDHFKKVNDTLGHQAGDQLLVDAASRIQACLRRDSSLSRFGGDEMLALIEDADSEQAVDGVAGRIAETMSRPFRIQDVDCQVSCSIGISRYPEDGDSVSELVRKADIAMYEVKTTGRNGFRTYAPGMHRYLDADRRQGEGKHD